MPAKHYLFFLVVKILAQKTKQDWIIYGKNMPNGSSVYVEEIRTGKKTLTTNSLRKYKTGVNPSSFAKRISNAHGNTGSISIVGKEDLVKNKETLKLFQTQNMFAPYAQTAQQETLPSKIYRRRTDAF